MKGGRYYFFGQKVKCVFYTWLEIAPPAEMCILPTNGWKVGNISTKLSAAILKPGVRSVEVHACMHEKCPLPDDPPRPR